MNNLQSLDTLKAKDLIDLIQKQTELVNWYWNFLIVTIAIILGWIVTRKNGDGPINKQVINFIIFGFIVFAIGNLVVVTAANITFALLIEELKIRANKQNSLLFANPWATQIINYFNPLASVGSGVLIHIIGDIVVVVILQRAKQLTKH